MVARVAQAMALKPRRLEAALSNVKDWSREFPALTVPGLAEVAVAE